MLAVRHIFSQQRHSVAHAIVRVLVYDYPNVSGNNHRKVDVNASNQSGGTLLSYAVQYGDSTAEVSRLLLNSGASVWDDDSLPDLPCSELLNDTTNSTFNWYLRSLMNGDTTTIETSKQTLYMLCTAMQSQQHNSTMGQHIDRVMLELGVAPKINGPLFKQLRAEIAPFITKPQSLRFICIKSIRKSIGKRQRQQMMRVSPVLKRLKPNSSSLQSSTSRYGRCNNSNTAIKTTTGTTISNCKLKLPHKLQQFVCLEEMVIPN